MPLILSTVCGWIMILLRWNRCLFQKRMWTLGQDSVFSITVASTLTSSFPRRGLPIRVKSSAPTKSTFSMRIRSPHSASMWFSIRIKSSPVTFHWRPAKCTTAKSRPKSRRLIRWFTVLTTAACRLCSSSAEYGLGCSGHGGLESEVQGIKSPLAELCVRMAAGDRTWCLGSNVLHVLHNPAYAMLADILTGSRLVPTAQASRYSHLTLLPSKASFKNWKKETFLAQRQT